MMAIRVYDLSKKYGVENAVLIKKLHALGYKQIKQPSAAIDKATAERLIQELGLKETVKTQLPVSAPPLPARGVRVYDLSKKYGVENAVLIKKLHAFGYKQIRQPSATLDKITAERLIQELGLKEVVKTPLVPVRPAPPPKATTTSVEPAAKLAPLPSACPPGPANKALFAGITPERCSRMSKQEKRWLDNIRKGLSDGLVNYSARQREDHDIEAFLIAIDTASTLRDSLCNSKTGHRGNRRKYIQFLKMVIPPSVGGEIYRFRDPRTGRIEVKSVAEIIYWIRCKLLHENENLNSAEAHTYAISINWTHNLPDKLVIDTRDDKVVFNGHFLWVLLQDVICRFNKGIIDLLEDAEKENSQELDTKKNTVPPPASAQTENAPAFVPPPR